MRVLGSDYLIYLVISNKFFLVIIRASSETESTNRKIDRKQTNDYHVIRREFVGTSQ